MLQVKSEYIKTNGITLHAVTAGPEEGPLVVLLHGFPEFWYGFKNQIEPLAKAGYRVVAPDQRGYNLSDKPVGIHHYMIDNLRDDIIGLIEQQNRKKAIIIGHDWGGAVAWHIGSTRPEYVEKLIPINIPHPSVMPRVIKNYPIQALQSSYILFFQLPVLPEKLFRANHFRLMKQAFYRTSKDQTFNRRDIEQYEEAWARPEALTNMLNWYRAMRKGSFNQLVDRPLTVPVRMIWGKEDQFLSVHSAKESLAKCIDGNMILVDGATHWLTHEYPELVNKLIQQFIEE